MKRTLIIFLVLMISCSSPDQEPGESGSSQKPTPTIVPIETPIPPEPPTEILENVVEPISEIDDDILQSNNDLLSTLNPLSNRCPESPYRYELAVWVYDLEEDQEVLTMQEEKPFPFSSAFKGPVFMYFLYHINPEIWESSDPATWKDLDRNDPLYKAYDMVVRSNNHATADILLYVNQNSDNGGRNALEQFNAWSREVIGTDSAAGLRMWETDPVGIELPTAGLRDESVTNDPIMYCRDIIDPNFLSVHDLGKYYLWLYNLEDDNPIRIKTYALLSITGGITNMGLLELLSYRLGAISVSKDGYHPAAGVDAGIMDFGDRAYIIATASYISSIEEPNANSIMRQLYLGEDDVISGTVGLIEQVTTVI